LVKLPPSINGDLNIMENNTREKLYLHLRDVIYRDILFLTKDRNLAEDVVHDSFIKVILNYNKLENRTKIIGWMKTIGRNTAYDLLKKNLKYSSMSSIEIVENTDYQYNILEKTVEINIENKMRDEMLYEALSMIKPNYQRALYLFYFQERSYKEISRDLNITEQALAQLLVRARNSLQKHYLRKWTNK